MEQFNRLENKLDKLDERLDAVDKHLAVYNLELKEHIRRTELLEAELKPIKSQNTLILNSFQVLKVIGSLLMFTVSVYAIINKLK